MALGTRGIRKAVRGCRLRASGLPLGIVKMTLKASRHFDKACGFGGAPIFVSGDVDDEGTMV